MAFKKTKDPRQVWRDVDIAVPIDGKGVQKVPLKIKFELLRDHEAHRLYDKEFFKRVVKGWEGYVMDGEGEQSGMEVPVPFTDENLAAFLSDEFVVASLQGPYIDCTVAAARGN